MGNNNSSNYGNGHISKSRHLPHDYHRKWGASSSDLGESSGNRMKKGYLPTRGYHGHNPRLQSPHKVLPVNPSGAKILKPTSNGAILHQGGTISGRKLLSELDPHSPEAEDLRRAMRKRSTASCPGNDNPNSGRSTPNLSIDYERNGPRRASSKGGSSRDYDSEPDLREIDDRREDSSPNRSISPVPNSFTLIQESPAKKQIRTKKKGKAPPPPISPGDHQMYRVGELPPCCSPHSPQLLSPCGGEKKVSRLFKTKAESRLANGPRSPEMNSDLEMSRGVVTRASMDANRFFRGDRDRSSLHSSVEAGLGNPKKLQVPVEHSHNQILSNRKHSEGGGGGISGIVSGGAARKASLGSAMLSSKGLSTRTPEVKQMMSPLGRDASVSKINDDNVPKSRLSNNLIPPITPYGQSNSGKPAVTQQKTSKGFISSSTSPTKTVLQHQNSSSSSNNSKPLPGKVANGIHGRRKATAAPAVPTASTTATANNNAESKTKFYFGMDAPPPPNNKVVATVHQQQSDSDNNNNERLSLVHGVNKHERVNNHNNVEKVSSSNSSAELLQIKQDSGSFDTEKGKEVVQRESSSELSSSDLDIPLNIRPTLPAKKLGLPRFSPTAAWRALDSPSRVSVSGRSYSSEEGYGHDRIQRYMRQIPPSRGHHERSAGDSGISAGDAGSPANQDLLGDQSTAANTPSSGGNHQPPPPPIMNGRYKDRSSKHHNGLRNDNDGAKCWTPEQDLDESSSSEEFEDHPPMSPTHHPIPSSHPVHHSGSVATRVLPGLGTPPKLTTRNNLFERGRNSALGMVSDSDHQADKPGNLYVRSRKAATGQGSGQTHEEIKKSQPNGGASRYYRGRSQPWRQGPKPPPSEKDFVGLDTNWFLSRSEPNSLNLIGNGEYDNIEQQELRLVLTEQDDDEDDELLCEGKKEMMLAMNMHGSGNGVDRVVNDYDEVDCGGARLESEIGYGPSSMSFSSPLPSPAVKLNKARRMGKEPQLVSKSTLLAEEFEKEQSPEFMQRNSNVSYGDSWERKPFSHIMYLPSYDSRRASSGTRRTKSVDNLNFSEMTVYQPRKTSQYNNISPVGAKQRQRRSRSPEQRRRKRIEGDEPFERSQSVPPFTAEEENERQRLMMEQQKERELQAEAARAEKKRKFKFQSTLRVLERKKIEEELSRDAEQKERRRLQEQEQMRKVEEEFQRKRVREKVLEMEAAAAAAAAGNRKMHNLDKIEAANRYDVNFEPRHSPSGNQRSGRSSNISYTTTMSNHHMYQRQEPEGAPSNNNGLGDLRKELICASRNRSGFPGQKHSELTQELSEFCTPTGQRQYFDYRRAHHDPDYMRSGPTTRYYNSSSSSDIFPVANRRDRRRGGGGSSVISSKSSIGYLRPTVHPQVVCDIPVKPLPYTVNFSRLSSSNMDLLTESDRPRSGLGGSVLSDNYRKDWAHHNRSGPARASSVLSLHSAPPLSNMENFRHSSVDLTQNTPPQSPRQSKYSTSPSPSPVSQNRPLSSPEERFYPNRVSQEMWSGDCVTGNKTVVMLNAPPPSSSPTPYQPAPAPYNRQKAFRPVDFNPSNSGGLSPAHAFHHASAKLTSPPVN